MTTPPAFALHPLRRSLLLAAAFIALATPVAFAQGTASPAIASGPSFDVATIKPHPTSGGGTMDWMGIRNDPDGIAAQYVTISMLTQRAYGLLTENQVSGAPEWAKTDRFDIQAKMSEADIAETSKLNPAEIQPRRERMMQALLAERFKLKAHSETRQGPVYELVVAKGGPRLKDAATDTSKQLKRGEDGRPIGGFVQTSKHATVAQGYSMQDLAKFLSQPYWSGLDRPVLDKTGLTGTYNFTLNWSSQMRALPGEASSPASPEEAGSLFTALEEVGLKLQPATGPIQTIVIDHVERPTAD